MVRPNPGNGDDASTTVWRSDLDRTIWAWRARELERGAIAADAVLASPEAPPEAKEVAYANSTWYAPTLAELLPSTGFSPLAPAVEPGWTRFNPSILAGEGDPILATVRSSNYTLVEPDQYAVVDASGVVRSETYLLELTEDLGIAWSRRIVSPVPRKTTDFAVRGYEDLRLVRVDGRLHATATVRDLSPSGLCQMVLLGLGLDGSVRSEVALSGPTPGRHEKNWVPLPTGALQARACAGSPDAGSGTGVLGIVYGWDPLELFEVDVETGRVAAVGERVATGLGGATRGGTQGVSFFGDTLFVVHESVRMPDGSRRYPHRFVAVGARGSVTGVSQRFFFFTRGVEFAAGLAAVGDRVLVSFGVSDERAWIASLRTDDVLGILVAPGLG